MDKDKALWGHTGIFDEKAEFANYGFDEHVPDRQDEETFH
jgi:hypothetical protein